MKELDPTLWEAYFAEPSEKSFTPIYEGTRALVYTICRRILGNEEDAHDAFQSAYGRLFEEGPQAAEAGAMTARLARLAVRESDNLRKRRGRREKKEIAMAELPAKPTGAPSPADLAARAETRDAVHSLVEGLPERYRVAVQLHYLGGLSRADVADALDAPVKTISTRLRTGLKLLAGPVKRAGLGDSARLFGAFALASHLAQPPASWSAGAIFAGLHGASAASASGVPWLDTISKFKSLIGPSILVVGTTVLITWAVLAGFKIPSVSNRTALEDTVSPVAALNSIASTPPPTIQGPPTGLQPTSPSAPHSGASQAPVAMAVAARPVGAAASGSGGQSLRQDVEQTQKGPDRAVVTPHAPRPRAAHVIKFPADRSLGDIKVRDWGTRDRTVHLGPAQGEVRIPRGQEVYLVVDEEAARDLSPIADLGFVDLQLLTLKGEHVDDSALAAIQHQTSLRELYLDFVPIRGEALAHLRHMSSLELISTIGTPLEDAALRHLAHLTALRHLGLHNTLITGKGLRFLKDLPALTSLSISGVSFQPEYLAQFQQFKTLRVLSLDTIDILDSDLKYLETLSSLKTLHLRDTKVTAAGIERLKQALPNCSISYRNNVGSPRATPTPLPRTNKSPLS